MPGEFTSPGQDDPMARKDQAKSSSFDRMVAADFSDEEKSELLTETGLKKMTEGGEPMENELVKTPEQAQVCSLMNDLTNKLRQKYGLGLFNVPVENMHIFPQNFLHFADGTELGGIFKEDSQTIYVKQGRSTTEFADYVCHELIHFKSHGALQVTTEGKIDYGYRSGFKARSRDGKKGYFSLLDEGLTETMCKEIIEDLKSRKDPLIAKDLEETEKVREEYSENAVISDYFTEGDILFAYHLPDNDPNREKGYKIHCVPYAYEGERKAVQELVAKVFDRNTDKFENQDEVFDLLAKGKLHGNFLGIGKIIDQSFGSGTFRKLGEASSNDLLQFEHFVKTL